MASTYAIGAPAGWRGATGSQAPPAFFEKAMTFAGLMVVMGTFQVVFPGQQVDRSAGDFAYQVASGCLYLATVVIAVSRGLPSWFFTLLGRSLPIIAFTFLTLASTLWSISPDVTFRRAAALILSSCFALFIVLRFDLGSFMRLLTSAFLVFIAVGFLAALIGEGITSGGPYAGAWRGLTGNKNEFGRTIALAVALLPVAGALRLIAWRTALLGAASAFILLVLSRSATAFVTAFGSVGIGAVIYVALGGRLGAARLNPVLGVALAVIGATAAALILVTYWTVILEGLGRDPTLTGRTGLWVWALQLNEGREWLGAGYRSFWIDSNTRYFFVAFAWQKDGEGNLSESFSGPSHGHSGYVDVILELGIVGLIAFAIAIFATLAKVRQALAHRNFKIGFILAVMLSFLLIYAITAKSVLQQSEDLWFLFSIFYLYALKEVLLNSNKNRGEALSRGEA